jgi:hypothetical protein
VHLPAVPGLIDDWALATFAPCKFHAATVDCSFGAGRYYGGLGDGDACVEHKGLALFLFASVGGKWECWVDAGGELGHVVVNIRLQNGRVGGSDVCDNKTLEGDHIGPFSGVIEGRVVYIIDGCHELVVCDGGYDKVGVPCLVFGKIGGSCLFAGGSSGGGIGKILGGSSRWYDECGPIALKVEDRVLEEAGVSFSVSPRARNGHVVGG